MSITRSNLILQIIAASITLSVSGTTFADNMSNANFSPYWYSGASILANYKSSDVSSGTYYDTKTHTQVSGSSVDDTTDKAGWALFAGYRATQHWAFELGYYKAHDETIDHHITTGTSSLSGNEKIHASVIAASALAILPIPNSAFSVYLRGGLGYHDQKDDSDVSTTTYVSGNGTHQESHFIYGFGAQYDFSQHFSMRADYILLDASAVLQNLDGGRSSLSVVYNF